MLGLQLQQGDIAPIVSLTLTDQAGQPVDLAPLASLRFRMVDARDGHVRVNNASATKAQADNQPATYGQVFYQWTTSDTARAGLYRAWFIVDLGSGPVHYPIAEDLYILIRLQP